MGNSGGRGTGGFVPCCRKRWSLVDVGWTRLRRRRSTGSQRVPTLGEDDLMGDVVLGMVASDCCSSLSEVATLVSCVSDVEGRLTLSGVVLCGHTSRQLPSCEVLIAAWL